MRTPPTKKPAPPPVMVRSNYFVPEAFKEGLRQVAAKNGGTEAEHLRKAVEQYLRRNKALPA